MSGNIQELRKLLAPPSTTVTGVVKSLSEGIALVSTTNGLVEATTITTLSVGDEVTVSGGVVLGSRVPAGSLPIFQV